VFQAGQARDDSTHFPWMTRVLRFLNANYPDRLPLAKIAQVAGVHPVHLMRTFRQVHGCTLGLYVQRLRIECARRKLISTDLAITEIALACGFCDQSHFTRVFRSHVGTSPRRFRESKGRL
jgi:AraC family transcriptional regulator